MCYTMPVFASEGVYDPDTSWWEKFVEESSAYIAYLCCRVGAVVKDYDFAKWVQTREDYKEWWNTGHISRLEDSSGNVSYSFDKELMAYIKQCLDEYAKEENSKEENGGFYLLPTTPISEVPVDRFLNAQQMRTFRNIVIEKSVLAVRVKFENAIRFVDPFSDPEHPILLVGDLSHFNLLETRPYQPVSSSFFCANDWQVHSYRVQTFPESDKIYTSCSEGIDYESGSNLDLYQKSGYMNWTFGKSTGFSENFTLYSTTGERVRVFISENAAKNYTVGNRKVFFAENYYSYEPEELKVTVDDLQKSVDDLQKVIDELLKQIGNDTSEKEIMDLLKQILEELRNQQGGGGGGGGGGDVNVNVDLSTTNNWLSKIYAKVSQIFDKISETAGSASDAVHTKIQEQLDEVIAQLKKIKHWTIADTVVDAADAVADWADLVLGVLKDAKEGADSAVAAITGAVGDSVDLMAKKFPFSIPWDILFFVSVLSAEPQVPQFEIPFNFEISALDITVDYTMKLDFTHLQWLSDLSRLLLSMTYAVGLMKMTFNVTSMGKEE